MAKTKDAQIAELKKEITLLKAKPKLTPTQEMQRALPEAVSSFTVEVKTPTGYSGMLTIRSDDEMTLVDRWMVLEMFLASNGYEPHQRYGKGSYKKPEVAKKPVQQVPGRMCPTCGSPLVYFEKPGQPGLKHIKCSTQKWDWKTKQPMGCPYVEWANQNAQPAQTFPQTLPTVTVPTIQATAPPVAQAPVAPDARPASPSQVKLIQDKWPTLYREGLTMTEAYAIIKANFSK